LRNHAMETYKTLNTTFYREFYDQFFDKSPGSKEFFKHTNLEEQYRKLHDAVDALLAFRPEDKQHRDVLRYTQRHRVLGLTPEHFSAFREAFIDTLLRRGFDEYAIDAWRAILNAGVVYMIGELSTRG